jgi:hypothetical protein
MTEERKGWVITHRDRGTAISVPESAILAGPHVQWDHVDGPLMTWAGSLHWLTWGERFRIWVGWATVDAVASEHWPGLARLRREIETRRGFRVDPPGEGMSRAAED